MEDVLREVGPIFSFVQAYQVGRSQSLTRQQVRTSLSKLARGGWVTRLKRGLYAVKTPLFGQEPHPYAVAQSLVDPSAISHWSALAHHGFTSQIPPMVQASTPVKVVTPEMRSGEAYRPRGRAVWQVLNLEIEYIHVQQEQFWGFTQEWVSDWHRVKITDPERTLLDLVARSDLFGGISMALETFSNHVRVVDVEQLVEYTLRYDVGSTIKRMGWILESNEVAEETLRPLLTYPTGNYHLLDPQGREGGEPVTRWNLYHNLPKGT